MSIQNILILGIGGVGLHVAKRLTHEGHSVTIIEPNPELVRYAKENLDARTIEGNAMQVSYWKVAQAEKMDLMIATTDNDAVNMLTALIADRFGISRKIVRARTLDFGNEDSILTAEDLKIDLMVNPEESVAQEIARLILRAAANDVLDLADGQMKVLATRIHETSPLINKTLSEISQRYNAFPFRVVAIARGITTIIPRGQDIISHRDQIFILARTQDLTSLMDLMGIQQRSIQRIMILGGGLIGYRIAQLLEKTVQIKLIEDSAKQAAELASTLKYTQVLHGDGTDANVLALAGVLDTETFIATTEDNETNIISCLLAKHLMNRKNRSPQQGATGKTIALVDKEDYLVLASTIGLDIALNAKISAANEILKFIRRHELLSVAHLHGVDAEVVELVAGSHSSITRKPLYKLSSSLENSGILIGGIFREGKWEIAVGETHIQSGERVIVICNSLSLKEVRKLFH